ncbi:MAG: phage major capsid protein [Eubacteriales bacterium]|nr:phage major capsid protein [Eubacteriales bacterium]
MTLFELKEKLTTLNAAIAADADWIAEKAADPSVPMEDIKTKTAHRDDLVTRRDLLQKQHDEMEDQQKKALDDQRKKSEVNTGDPDKDSTIKAKAAFYKAALMGDTEAAQKAYEGLGAIPAASADLGSGDNLLPTVMESTLITEPFDDNPLRTIEQVSQVTGLEEPKLLFGIEDEDLADITDKETAKEIEMTGGTVSYGRFKTKIVATVKDTVLHGTPTNLVTTVENALRSGLARKEKIRAFSTTPDSTHDHMSFYLKTGITPIPGDDIIDAILKALGDLADHGYGENASVVMRRSDYNAAIKILANNNAALWGAKPEDVIGYPVTFIDKAVVPVVGDFRYSRQNYDIGTIYETDKDGKKGEYYFILTAWGDHQIKLASAFRTAYIRVMLIGAVASAVTTLVAGNDLTVVDASLVFNDGGAGTDGTITYLWQKLNGDDWTDLATGTGYNTKTYTTAAGAATYRCKVTYVDDDGPSIVYTNALTVAAE